MIGDSSLGNGGESTKVWRHGPRIGDSWAFLGEGWAEGELDESSDGSAGPPRQLRDVLPLVLQRPSHGLAKAPGDLT